MCAGVHYKTKRKESRQLFALHFCTSLTWKFWNLNAIKTLFWQAYCTFLLMLDVLLLWHHFISYFKRSAGKKQLTLLFLIWSPNCQSFCNEHSNVWVKWKYAFHLCTVLYFQGHLFHSLIYYHVNTDIIVPLNLMHFASTELFPLKTPRSGG